MPASLEARWWLRINQCPSGCWEWQGTRDPKGYGRFMLPGAQTTIAAHKWGYEHLIGPVPDGLELDHLCRNPPCCNPAHLEPVTHTENVRRGLVPIVNGRANAAKTHCPRGHEYTPENTYYRPGRPGRNCRACGVIVAQRLREERRAKRSQARTSVA